MKAVLFKGKDYPVAIEETKKPKPVKDQVLIRMHYAALNHRDLWVMQEQAQHFPNGIVLGSDGCGVIDDVGEDTDPLLIGAEVIVNPSLEWGTNPFVQGDSFKILGFPDNGTLAEYMVVSKKNIFERPENLSMEEAAAIPLSGLTAYRALFSKARLRSKEKVLITGTGGAAALWALQFAVAYQARVYVTSGSDEKLAKAKAMGAAGGFNYNDPEWVAKAQKEAGGFDIIIDSAGGDSFAQLLELALPGGRIVNFGRTAGNTADGLSLRTLYWKQLSLYGTTMGTRDEFLSMIDFIESRNLKPVIDQVYPLDQFEQAKQRLERGEQFGKIVLKIKK